MAEIENMPAAVSEAGEHSGYLALDNIWRCQQNRRVQVSLQRNAIAHVRARTTELSGPVNTKGIGTTVRKGLEPLPTAFGKDDARHPMPIPRRRQIGTDLFNIRE